MNINILEHDKYCNNSVSKIECLYCSRTICLCTSERKQSTFILNGYCSIKCKKKIKDTKREDDIQRQQNFSRELNDKLSIIIKQNDIMIKLLDKISKSNT
jgi:hypothetical protein